MTTIKSKQRVVDHGEVYTNHREVSAMVDLVSHEANRIESKFLEPACGNGNFLIEVLKRKVGAIQRRYSSSQIDFERYLFLASSSVVLVFSYMELRWGFVWLFFGIAFGSSLPITSIESKKPFSNYGF